MIANSFKPGTLYIKYAKIKLHMVAIFFKRGTLELMPFCYKDIRVVSITNNLVLQFSVRSLCSESLVKIQRDQLCLWIKFCFVSNVTFGIFRCSVWHLVPK